jgi:hypothetical protein
MEREETGFARWRMRNYTYVTHRCSLFLYVSLCRYGLFEPFLIERVLGFGGYGIFVGTFQCEEQPQLKPSPQIWNNAKILDPAPGRQIGRFWHVFFMDWIVSRLGVDSGRGRVAFRTG